MRRFFASRAHEEVAAADRDLDALPPTWTRCGALSA
jgi:hypothetical protein